MKKYLAIALFSTLLFSIWDVEETLYTLPKEAFLPIKDEEFLREKKEVIEKIKNSWCSQEKAEAIMDLIKIFQPSICVEVGVFLGDSLLPCAAALRNNGKGIVYAVDAWDTKETLRYLDEKDPNTAWWGSLDMQNIKQQFLNRIKEENFSRYVYPIEAPSIQASAIFADNQIEFLHLDGDFSEKGSFLDVQYYLPKVKKGGIIILSNALFVTNKVFSKTSSFIELIRTCKMLCSLEKDNVYIFIKSAENGE